jgi:hypothetical protein
MVDRAHAGRDGYDVLAKWSTPSFDAYTRDVLSRRLQPPGPPRFFEGAEFHLLEAICARLLATPPGDPPIANCIDAELAEGRGQGFRVEPMPPDRDAWRRGLHGIAQLTSALHGTAFVHLDAQAQDEVLRLVQRGDADAAAFDGLDAKTFFTHVLLKGVAAHFYSQPQAWSEIGFGGPASPRGYVRIGLDERDPWESPRTAGGDGDG